MRSAPSLLIFSSISILAFIVGLGSASAIVGEQTLRRDGQSAVRVARDVEGLTGAALSTRIHELLRVELLKVAQERQSSLASKVVLERVLFQRDSRFVYADISLSDASGPRQLHAVVDGFDGSMTKILSTGQVFGSTGNSQAVRVAAPAGALAERFSVRLVDAAGEDVPMFSPGDVADGTPIVGPETPLVARDVRVIAGLLSEYFGRSDIVPGQGMERFLDDFRNEVGLGAGPRYATLADLFALRIRADKKDVIDLRAYYEWRLAADNLQGRRERPDAPPSSGKNKAESDDEPAPGGRDELASVAPTASGSPLQNIVADDEIAFAGEI